MSKQHLCEVVDKRELLHDIYRFTVSSSVMAQNACPGQFLEIKCGDGLEVLLRRPISISAVDKNKGEVSFIFRMKGKGTQTLARKKAGESLDILGPLGKGFSISSQNKKAAVIGGGIGIFPLLFLANELKVQQVYTYLGFRNKNFILLEDEFKSASKQLSIATDDGSYGTRALVTDLLLRDIENTRFDMIYSCGPLPMLKKVKEVAESANIPCEISVEERMGCGVGACLGCACKLTDGEDFKFGHVCKDGPVFNANEIILE